VTKNAPSEALVEAMARAICKADPEIHMGDAEGVVQQLVETEWRNYISAAKAAATVSAEAMAANAAKLAERDREIEAQGNYLDDIKQEALTAGAPGQRSTAKALAHIVRLCVDARAALGSAEG